MNWIEEIRHDISNLPSSDRILKKFGLTVGGVFLLFGVGGWKLMWWGETVSYSMISAGVLLVVGGFFFAGHLRTLHRYWMGFAIILG
ncbi:MAG: hypothetical protein WCW40_11760, partial [Bacteroidota bacterium]